jgi:hypothetical protein
MNHKTKWVAGVLVVIALAAVVVLRKPSSLDRGNEAAAASADHVATKKADVQRISVPDTTRNGSSSLPAQTEVPRDNPYWVETRASNLTEAFRRVAASDDPAALAVSRAIMEQCSLFTDVMYPRTVARIKASPLKDDKKQRQLSAAQRGRARCEGFTDQDVTKSTERSALLTQSKDPRAVASDLLMTQPAEAFASAKAAAQLKDPFAIQEVGNYFFNRIDLPRSYEYDLGDGLIIGRRAIMDAFNLAACEFGTDCGADNVFVLSQCIALGYCDSGSLQETYAQYRYSPADFQRLAAARDVVLRGLRTGEWPTNFWPAPQQTPAHLLKK